MFIRKHLIKNIYNKSTNIQNNYYKKYERKTETFEQMKILAFLRGERDVLMYTQYTLIL